MTGLVVINPGVYWKCVIGACRTPSACQMAEKCLISRDEAADEIERLHRDRISGEAVITKLSFALKEANEAIRELQQAACDRDGVPMPSQRPVVEKLRADLRSAKMALQPEQKKHAKARQEIEQLRVALRDVLRAFEFWQTLDPAGPRDADETGRFVHDIEAAIARARAALGEDK